MSFAVSVKLTVINCHQCGGSYALNERYRLERQQKGGSWHCPYCGVASCYRESDNAKLQKELAQERAKHDQTRAELEHQAKVAKQVKAAHDRTVKRVKNGVCPCCNRTFCNVQRHMKSKHPEYVKVKP